MLASNILQKLFKTAYKLSLVTIGILVMILDFSDQMLILNFMLYEVGHNEKDYDIIWLQKGLKRPGVSEVFDPNET